MTGASYNNIIVRMIPDLVFLPDSPWDVLPVGIHPASLTEVMKVFAINTHRRKLFDGLLSASSRLYSAGCQLIYLNGSYVTSKPYPNDYDVCWDPNGVDNSMLDPEFSNFRNGRAAQKARFKGEFFPSSMNCIDIDQTFLDFFQLDRFTGTPKGIISISLVTDPLLLRRAKP